MLRCPHCGARPDASGGCPWHAHGRNALLPTQPPPPVLEGFDLRHPLGSGAHATVWAARRSSDGRELCVKLGRTLGASEQLAWELEVGMQRRAYAVAPAIVDHGVAADGVAWIAMERVHGTTLAELLAMNPAPWPCDEVARALAPLLAAVQRLHDDDIVHGDLKPENIFLAEGRATLVDFGCSAPAGSSSEVATGVTAEYAAPERCSSRPQLHAASDVYALAVLTHELLVGAPPFWGPEELVLESHRARRPRSLVRSGLPRELDDVIRGALAKPRERRPQSAAAFGDLLLPALRSAGGRKSPVPGGSRGGSTKVAVEREPTPLVWLRTDGELAPLQSALLRMGGVVAHVGPEGIVAAFLGNAARGPLARAWVAAQALFDDRLCTRALLDVRPVAILAALQPPRILAPGFERADRYPSSDDPPVSCTQSAAHLLADAPLVLAAGHSDRWVAADAGRRGLFDELPTPTLRGRDAELEQLELAAARASAGAPTLVTVLAAPGTGRSRFAHDLHERLEHVGMQVLTVRPSASAPRATATLTASVLGLDVGDAALLGQLAVRLGIAPRDIPIGLLLALDRLDEHDPMLARLRAAPGAIRQAISSAVAEAIVSASTMGRLAIVVDDADRIDAELLDALELATSRTSGRLLVCAIARPELALERRDWGRRANAMLTLELGPLGVDDTAALVREALRPALNVADDAIAEIHRRTLGLPLQLVELLRALRANGALRPVAGSSAWVFASEVLGTLPDTPVLAWAAQAELERLPRTLARHAAVLAVMGPDTGLEPVLDELERQELELPTDLDAEVALQRLVRTGIVDVQHGIPVFRTASLREHALAMLEPSVRRRLHATAYALASALPLEVRLHHASGAELHRAAAIHARALAELASARHDYLEAERCYGLACKHLEAEHALDAQVLHGRALMRFRLGRHDDARVDLERALALIDAGDGSTSAVELLLDAATIEDWCESFDRAAALVVAASSRHHGGHAPLLEARFALARGRSHFRAGRIEAAIAELESAASGSKAVGDAAYEVRVVTLLLLAPLLGMTGRAEESLPLFDELFAVCREHSDRIHLATALLNRPFVWIELGRVEALRDDLRQVVEISRACGFPLLEGKALHNLGEIAYLTGAYDEALRHAQEAAELERGIAARGQGWMVARLLQARILARAGELGTAAGIVAELRAHQAEAGPHDVAGRELAVPDELLCCMVELVCHAASIGEWQALIARAVEASVQQELVEVLELAGVAARRAGAHEQAREWLHRALAEVEATTSLLRPRIEAAIACVPAAALTA